MYITVEGILPPDQEVSFEFSTTQEQIDKIIQWSKDNPKKTKLQDFLEKYPDAPMKDGVPCACSASLGYKHDKEFGFGCIDCAKCWNEPVD